MRTHQYYPLAEYPHFGVVAVRGEAPRVARFLTPEKAKAIAATPRDIAA